VAWAVVENSAFFDNQLGRFVGIVVFYTT
jgi:hypothetical protein